MGLADISIEGFEVEAELSQILRLKPAYFEFNADEAIEPAMEEEKIERKISVADLDWILGTDKAEVSPQLNQEVLELEKQAAMQIRFPMHLRQIEKLQHVRIFE
jgi:hypothetical protein